MTSYIKSKIQRSISFLPVMVMAFSVCSGVVFFNPSPSYGYHPEDVERARKGDKNLIGADLIGADLRRARLDGALLLGARLTGADLIGVDLLGARLTGADLTGANLNGANLTGANLVGVDLTGADLTGADLTGADLTGADLSEMNSAKVESLSNYIRSSRLNQTPGTIRIIQAAKSNQALKTDLSTAKLDGAIADKNTKFPEGFDAAKAGVIIK